MPHCPACSYEWKGRPPKPRSVQQHKRFFGMMRAAYSNWPVSYTEIQPRDATELRKWLTAKAGYVSRTIIDAPGDLVGDDEIARKKALLWLEQSLTAVKSDDDHSWIRRHGNGMVVFKPLSIAFDRMGPQDFGMLNDKVSAQLVEIIGLDGDELLERNRQVAS